MREITLQLDDVLADKLRVFAETHQTSIEAMAVDYFAGLVGNAPKYDDITLTHQKDVEKRLQAIQSGEMKTVSLDEFKVEMAKRLQAKKEYDLQA